jgi:hypothetical protein
MSANLVTLLALGRERRFFGAFWALLGHVLSTFTVKLEKASDSSKI